MPTFNSLLKELATNKDDNAIHAAQADNETEPPQLQRVEQLQGLGIFVADSLEEQFTNAEYLVEEGRAFFNNKNLERLKKISLSEGS